MAKLYNTQEVADLVGCGRSTVQRLCRNHKIGSKVGRDLVLTAADVRRIKEVRQRGFGSPVLISGTPEAKSAMGKAAVEKRWKKAKR